MRRLTAVLLGVVAIMVASLAPANARTIAPGPDDHGLTMPTLPEVTAAKRGGPQGIAALLNRHMLVNGTSWWIDIDQKAVRLTYDSQVSRPAFERLRELVAPFGPEVRLEKRIGVLRPSMEAGAAIYKSNYTSGPVCTMGFNVTKDDGRKYFLSAGHCPDGLSMEWHASLAFNSASLIGDVRSIWFNNSVNTDLSITAYTNPNAVAQGVVDLYDGTYQDIQVSRITDENEHEWMCKSGWRTLHTCGRVVTTHGEATYSGVHVNNLIVANICVLPGDSGGPLHSGVAAIGVTVATDAAPVGERGCTSGAYGYFVPVPYAEQIWDVHVF